MNSMTDQNPSEATAVRALDDAELEAVSGGFWFIPILVALAVEAIHVVGSKLSK